MGVYLPLLNILLSISTKPEVIQKSVIKQQQQILSLFVCNLKRMGDKYYTHCWRVSKLLIHKNIKQR